MRRTLVSLLAILLVAAMLVTGCATKAPAEGGDLKIGLVTDVGRVNDRTFNQSAWEGVQDVAAELGVEAKYVETKAATDYLDNIRQFTEEDYDVIVTVGFALGPATLEMAAQYPDIMFIGVDQFQAEVVPNVAGLVFHEDYSGYLAGVLAAKLTKTGTIGGVFGTDLIPAVVAFREGYEAGARSVNPDINIISAYHPGEIAQAFTDPEWGAATAAQAIDGGADVVFAAGGQTGNGALEETATHEGFYCIGVDQDQWESLPGAHPCLVTSAIKTVRKDVAALIRSVADGTFEGGQVYGDAGLAPYHDFEDQLPDELKAELEQIAAGLKDGSISTGYGQ
ncbi:MAG: BMP family lipoprotein [Anaerolineae bacterium]